MKTLRLLSIAITEQYKNDQCKPGIVVSYLGENRTGPDADKPFYASILRHPGGPNHKMVVAFARGKTATAALKALSTQWLSQFPKPEARENLKDHLDA